ncbi:MAG: hypothetical protein J5517_03495 [Eubacterium sp.]|nr:hypothetical protein [Eubacterium sp.]
MDEMFSVGDFIEMLDEDVVSWSWWTEDQDLMNWDRQLDRRTAARLIHMYMKVVKRVEDLKDITPAYELRDLFDCRVCANHVAQVYLRGIMPGVKVGDIEIFDVYKDVSREEAEDILKQFSNINNVIL